MGREVLAEILADWTNWLDGVIYVSHRDALSPSSEVTVFPLDPRRKAVHEGQRYWLEVELVRDIVVGLEEQLGRSASIDERFRAVHYYATNDAYIPLDEVGLKS